MDVVGCMSTSDEEEELSIPSPPHNMRSNNIVLKYFGDKPPQWAFYFRDDIIYFYENIWRNAHLYEAKNEICPTCNHTYNSLGAIENMVKPIPKTANDLMMGLINLKRKINMMQQQYNISAAANTDDDDETQTVINVESQDILGDTQKEEEEEISVVENIINIMIKQSDSLFIMTEQLNEFIGNRKQEKNNVLNEE